MALCDDREAIALDAVDEPHLPDRLRAVEPLREDPRREVPELLLRARRRQGGVADVVVEVELGVVDPYRPALPVGDEPQLLAEPRHQLASPASPGEAASSVGLSTERKPSWPALSRGAVVIRAPMCTQ